MVDDDGDQVAGAGALGTVRGHGEVRRAGCRARGRTCARSPRPAAASRDLGRSATCTRPRPGQPRRLPPARVTAVEALPAATAFGSWSGKDRGGRADRMEYWKAERTGQRGRCAWSRRNRPGLARATTMMSVAIAASRGIWVRTESRMPRKRRCGTAAFRTRSEPDCGAIYSCGMTFGVCAIAAMTSSVKKPPGGLVRRTRSSPSMSPRARQRRRRPGRSNSAPQVLTFCDRADGGDTRRATGSRFGSLSGRSCSFRAGSGRCKGAHVVATDRDRDPAGIRLSRQWQREVGRSRRFEDLDLRACCGERGRGATQEADPMLWRPETTSPTVPFDDGPPRSLCARRRRRRSAGQGA